MSVISATVSTPSGIQRSARLANLVLHYDIRMKAEPKPPAELDSSSRPLHSTNKERKKHHRIEGVVSRFIAEIDSLADTLPFTMASIAEVIKSAQAEMRKFIADHGEDLGNGEARLNISAENVHRFDRLIKRLRRTEAASVLIPRSFVVALVSQFDSFLGSLIRALLLAVPEVLNGSDRSLSFADLVGFGSLDAARDHIIEKEVESVLRKSHSEQFEWLENKFRLKLRQDLTVWPTFIELTERRNLFVHTGGRVSAQYLEICRTHKADCSGVKRGSRLRVTPAYFRSAHAAVFEIGVKLAHVLWRKLLPEQRKMADENLVSISYDLLIAEEYDLAKAVLDFATEVLKQHSSEAIRLKLLVNRILAYKWSGDDERASRLLQAQDFSAVDDQFKLAAAALRGNTEDAIRMVRKIGALGDMTLEQYREWPLFRELRTQVAFQKVVEEVFREPLNEIHLAESKHLTNNPIVD
jgi:hypothetical protein